MVIFNQSCILLIYAGHLASYVDNVPTKQKNDQLFFAGCLPKMCLQLRADTYKWLNKLSTTPNIICDTPKITDSFIFNELVNVSLLLVSCQT